VMHGYAPGGSSAGASTVSGTLAGKGRLAGLSAGESTVTGGLVGAFDFGSDAGAHRQLQHVHALSHI
jgi:hypothetical protein